jgi:phosphotransferase system enzyme I (PtsI)
MVLKNAKAMAVTFRTIDVGADRTTWDTGSSSVASRGLRFCLQNQDLFRAQLSALFQASVKGAPRILLPFVSSIDDLDEALGIINSVKADLSQRKKAFAPRRSHWRDDRDPCGGAKPATSWPHVWIFFCLGTNDLIQYLPGDRSLRPVGGASL